MPVVALTPTFALFIAGLSVVNFALNGECSLGSAHGLDGLFAPPPTARRRACRAMAAGAWAAPASRGCFSAGQALGYRGSEHLRPSAPTGGSAPPLLRR